VVSALAVPLTVGYLGADRFGALAAAMAVIALLDPLDLGIGSALVTLLGRADGDDDAAGGAALERAAVALVSAVAVVLGAVAVVVVPRVDWAGLVHSGLDPSGAQRLAAVLAGAFVIGLPLGLVDRVHLGHQESHRNGVMILAGNSVAFALLVVAAAGRADLWVLAACLTGGPLAARAVAGALLVARARARSVRAGGEVVAVTEPARLLLSVGARFFLLQLAMAVAFTSDQVVVARVLGADAVVSYAVPFRLFAMISGVTALAARPLWPAYAEAAARGDAAWVRRGLVRSLALTVAVATVLSVPLVVAGPWAVEVMGRGAVGTSWSLLVGLGLWTVMGATGTTFAMALNGLGALRFQVVVASVMAVVNLALSIVLARRVGVAGVVWGTVVSYGLIVGVPSVVLVRRWLRDGIAT
jgi:O-antigen/teichoic acid export membrane protein